MEMVTAPRFNSPLQICGVIQTVYETRTIYFGFSSVHLLTNSTNNLTNPSEETLNKRSGELNLAMLH